MSQHPIRVQAIRPGVYSRRITITNDDPFDICHFDIHTDPTTKSHFILWDDIKPIFDNALHVQYKASMITFHQGAESAQ
ncbi:hypothetical protein EC991_002888 [Linnemannia zychae]|nr:hypothetical protein EC991_002888 [Linnemannia zychae]